MADILIRGMEMPPSCSDCPMCYDQMECTVRPIRFWHEELPMDFCNERHPDCPLRELPEHGDLIEADKLRALAYERAKEYGCVAFVDALDIALAPIIVPSNREETE